MNVLFVSTEAAPFAKSGGLGDVIGSLPREMKKQGIDARVMLPLYQSIKNQFLTELKRIAEITVMLSWRAQYCGIFEMEYDGVTFYFLDNEQYFGRDAYYGYEDDGERFAFYAKASLDVLQVMDFKPEILHCSEWQTAMVPVFLKTLYKGNPQFDHLRTIFTIHNIEYQGKFDKSILGDILGISNADRGILEYHGAINYMKGAIVACDRLTTVSPSYSEEISHAYYGRGLEHIIKENQYKLSGILNGIDTQLYHPAKNPNLAVKYSKNSMVKKKRNKASLQEELGLAQEPETPIIAMIGRLVEHKGIDLVIGIFDEMMRENVQFVMLGIGNPDYENYFQRKSEDYGNRMSVCTGFSEALANRIYAGADLFLMPSLSEPCGLAQMIALGYGTIPVVRETGGLRDTVMPFNPETGQGNGVTFRTVNAHDMLDAVKRGLGFFHEKERWMKLMENAFESDFSWKASSKKYIKLYKELLE